MSTPQNNEPASQSSSVVYVTWVAWDANGRGSLFKAPADYSKEQACKYAEKIYATETFVTVHQL